MTTPQEKPTMTKTPRLTEAAQLLLDQLVNDLVTLRWTGETWIAQFRRGSGRARRVGREMRTLITRGLIDATGRTSVTDAGFDAANIADGNDRETLRHAYRMARLPREVMAADPLMPEPVREPGEEPRADPREGYTTFDFTDRLQQPTRSRYPGDGGHDHWEVDVVVRVGEYRRFHLLFYGPDAVARRKSHGPLVRGVYASAYGLSSVITADPRMSTAADIARDRAAGRMFDVQLGDVIDFRGFLFVVQRDHNDNIKLTRMRIPGQESAS